MSNAYMQQLMQSNERIHLDIEKKLQADESYT